MSDEISTTSKKKPIRSLKLILILVLAEVFDLLVAAVGWNWYPSMPLVFRLLMSAVFCLAAWLIARPFLNKVSTTQETREQQ